MIQTLFGSDEPEKSAEEGAQEEGLFDRMRQAVSRTRESFSQKSPTSPPSPAPWTKALFEELETALLTSDLGVANHRPPFSTHCATAPAIRPSKAARSFATC